MDKTTKGSYIEDFRRAYARQHGRELRVLFAGDDTTDETVLSALHYSPSTPPTTAPTPDVGIRVGGGETSATHRLDTPEDVRDFLQDLLRRRDGRSAD